MSLQDSANPRFIIKVISNKCDLTAYHFDLLIMQNNALYFNSH